MDISEKFSERKFIAHRREKDGAIQDLFCHLKEVSFQTGKYASKIGLEKQGQLIGLLHDLGKASLEFEQYIKLATGLIDQNNDDYVETRRKKGEIDHSTAGAQVIYRYFSDSGNESLFVSQILPLVISSHHSGLIDCLTPDGNDNFTKRMNKPDDKTRINESLINLNEHMKQKLDELLSDSSLVKLLNQKVLSVREDNDSRESLMFKVGLLIRFLFSCLIDADRINTADFEHPDLALQRNRGKYESWSVLIEKLEQHLRKFPCQTAVDALRRDISDCCLDYSRKPKGLYQVTVPTGGGKTLASLRFALHHAEKHNMDRILYIIPYTSIIDQNAQTAREILEDKSETGAYLNNIILEHHSNLTPEEENDKQKLLSENWDAPVVFTTMVQFLETLFGYGTRSARRLHQLANAVIIFDEIQTLPIRCVYQFNLAVRFLVHVCGATVVLCTATQPLLDRIKPDHIALQITPGQQMMPDVQKLFKELKRVEVYDYRKIGGWTNEEVADLAAQELQETGSVLLIVNTKKAAVNLFKQLQSHSHAKLFHLSTNMCAAHRMENIAEIKRGLAVNKPIVCVSTQLIEAGVDIDFGTVIRYVAGLDSIAQAAGRCNRHGARPNKGRVFVVNPKEENLDKLRDIKIGREVTDRLFGDYKNCPEQFDKDILGLKAMESYYQYYFYNQQEKMCYPVNKNSIIGRDDNLFNLLSLNSLSVDEYRRKNNNSFPDIPLRQAFMSAAKEFQAINSPSRGIIVPYGNKGKKLIHELCSARYFKEQYTLLKEAQRFSINIHPRVLDELIRQKAIHEVQRDSGVFYLDERYYSEEFGMSTSMEKNMEFLFI